MIVGEGLAWGKGPVGNVGQGDVVDRGHRQSSTIQDLTVQQMQPCIDQPSGDGCRVGWVREVHEPAPVMINSGTAASEATRITIR